MTLMFVLYEHAAGYSLFRVKEFEEAGMFLAQVEESVTDLSKFNSVVQLTGFMPFKSAANALANINCISEGVLPDDLHAFLENNVPKKSKKNKVTVGVTEPKLCSSIIEALGITCIHTGVVPEITRGIRFHFHNLVKGFTALTASKAQLGLGHSYSRAKVKFNVHRADNMIIQSIALLDQLDKDINTFSMRIREWYSYHFPELIKIVPDNYMYARCAKLIKNRKEMKEDLTEALEEVVMDTAKVQAIWDASKSSMGMDISPIDLINIERFASRVIALAEYRKGLQEYLRSKMNSVAPNLSTLIGEVVGARLISHAGSLTNLAKYPASTVQILGAEKALFRALKTRGNTPKYGLLFHSTFIGRAGTKNKGRISRYLANKCSIASRIDCFSENPTVVFGEKLKEQVEERLKFYESGEVPRKNVDVMREAIQENAELQEKILKKKRKKAKKDKKRENGDVTLDSSLGTTLENSQLENSNAVEESVLILEKSQVQGEDGDPRVHKSKKKKKKVVDVSLNSTLDSTMDISNGLEESARSIDLAQVQGEDGSPRVHKSKKKKKKGVDESLNSTLDSTLEKSNGLEESAQSIDNSQVQEEDGEPPAKKSKKKKKKKNREEKEMEMEYQ